MSIDWKKQWKFHAPNFKNGYAHLHPRECSPFRLLPGPGFGDNSHPTTQLMLQLMPDLVKGKHVIDIGCGSGILSIAAAKMGALSVHGVDIDPLALTHARKNAELNNLTISFSTHYNPSHDAIYLMNMIPLEQREAVRTLTPSLGSLWLISGILSSQSYKPGTVLKEFFLGEWKAMLVSDFNKNII
ncbi:MAG: 50S ribosomal protein L11 methyltransferase [Simkaniaceae bacterium]|nr:50S ribosomal protein L11 methyltransferase [Simkaniaceae bacterium]